jgi:hypothetical protein
MTYKGRSERTYEYKIRQKPYENRQLAKSLCRNDIEMDP